MRKLIVIAVLLAFSAPALARGDAQAGEGKAKPCAACHGADGNSPTAPDFPRLAGQHYDYLLKALRDYKSGARKNPIMAAQLQNLKRKDLEDLAAFFAAQKGSLAIVGQ